MQHFIFNASDPNIAQGETLVVLSDGPGDAVGDDGGERYGDERVQQTIQDGPGDPAGLVQNLLDRVAEYTGNAPQADDQTLLAIALG